MTYVEIDWQAVLAGLMATLRFGLWTLGSLLAIGVVIAVVVMGAFAYWRAKELSR